MFSALWTIKRPKHKSKQPLKILKSKNLEIGRLELAEINWVKISITRASFCYKICAKKVSIEQVHNNFFLKMLKLPRARSIPSKANQGEFI